MKGREPPRPPPSGQHVGTGKTAFWLRLGVAAFWAVVIGSLMAIGASLLGLPGSDIPWIALLGGFGAAVFVLFFAGRI